MELLESGETFKQATEESATETVEHGSGWDQSECCGGRKSESYNYPSLLRQRLHNLRGYELDWLVKAVRSTWLSTSQVLINVRNWRTMEGQMLLRELGIREAVFEPR